MAKKKVVHYINQFYAGVGGETDASVGLSVHEGPKGPGVFLGQCLGDDYEVLRRLFVEIIRLQNIQKKLFRRL